MMQNYDSQFLTLNDLNQIFADGRVCVGISMKGVVIQIRGEVL